MIFFFFIDYFLDYEKKFPIKSVAMDEIKCNGIKGDNCYTGNYIGNFFSLRISKRVKKQRSAVSVFLLRNNTFQFDFNRNSFISFTPKERHLKSFNI